MRCHSPATTPGTLSVPTSCAGLVAVLRRDRRTTRRSQRPRTPQNAPTSAESAASWSSRPWDLLVTVARIPYPATDPLSRTTHRGQVEPSQVVEVGRYLGDVTGQVDLASSREDGTRLVEVAGELGLLGPVGVVRVAHFSVRPVRDVGQSHWRLGRAGVVPPHPTGWLEPVVGQQPPPLPCHQRHRLDEIVEDGRGDEVVEV